MTLVSYALSFRGFYAPGTVKCLAWRLSCQGRQINKSFNQKDTGMVTEGNTGNMAICHAFAVPVVVLLLVTMVTLLEAIFVTNVPYQGLVLKTLQSGV